MIGMNVWWVYLAPQNIPRAIVLTLGNKVILFRIVLWCNYTYSEVSAKDNVGMVRNTQLTRMVRMMNISKSWCVAMYNAARRTIFHGFKTKKAGVAENLKMFLFRNFLPMTTNVCKTHKDKKAHVRIKCLDHEPVCACVCVCACLCELVC